MFVTYLFHSYLLSPHNVKCLYAFETGIADTALSTYMALNWIPWQHVKFEYIWKFACYTLVETQNVLSSFNDN